jgi:hypothetical protein
LSANHRAFDLAHAALSEVLAAAEKVWSKYRTELEELRPDKTPAYGCGKESDK